MKHVKLTFVGLLALTAAALSRERRWWVQELFAGRRLPPRLE